VKDISGLLCATDLLVHGSFLEGRLNSVLEAMAVGLPVAAADIPGIREAVGPAGYEHLAPVGDPDTLTKRTLRFALHAQLRQEVGAANRARIAMFLLPKGCVAEQRMFFPGVCRRPEHKKPRAGPTVPAFTRRATKSLQRHWLLRWG
jgi:glycosyltransferase involved in cell wall biosynthesis